ncbi:hypothetical protein [uncultured Cohaesibacter sp.]|uniref:phage nozzle protein n=1 Tax=uncultured Cohaesibacter sp. TaxID=1002546 RepID=UPI0029C8482B|nr:hypothetical protein [uncultured Cohaesibacter sp.]
MAAVSGSIPNLIGGVSQQPPEIRALNTSTALTNTWSSVVSGLGTRPGTEYIGALGVPVPNWKTPATHGIMKPSGTYMITVIDSQVFVVDLVSGTLATVTVEDGANGYLNTDDAAVNIRFATIGDTTFILNRSVIPAVTSTPESGLYGIADEEVVRLNPNLLATHWVKQSAGYTCNYTVYLNNALLANAATDQSPETVTATLRSAMATAGSSLTEVSSTITSISLESEDDFITATDGFGDQATLGYNDYIDEFTDLPNMDIGGRLVMVKQAGDEEGDDYWVWRYGGAWQETYGWGAYEKPVPSTMPVVLKDNLDGTFTLKHMDWPGREAGDADSNPTPSFVGHPINDMFRYKGRLVFLSDENVLMSQKGRLENFYRTTCMQLLDEDRIDIAASESRGAELVGARPFDKGLLIFSSTDQFYLHGDNEGVIGPNTVDMDLVNTYTASGDLQPIGVGPNVVFVDDPEEGTSYYSQLREYQVERVFGQQVALSITDQIPEYIPAGIYRMLSVSQKSAVILASSGDPSSLYCYNYYYNNDGKVQSSWQRWQYHFNVLNVVLVADALYLLISYRDHLYVVRQRFSEAVSPKLTEEDVLLDMRLSSEDLSVSYESGKTYVEVPFPIPDLDHIVAVVAPDSSGSIPKGQVYKPSADSTDTKLIFNRANLFSEKFFVGRTFKFDWEPSPIFFRDEKMVVVQDGRLQLSQVSLLFNGSGPFEVQVTPPSRDTYVKKFTGLTIGSGGDTLNTSSLDDGKAVFSAPGKSDKVKIRVVAETPWRVRFSSLEWSGRYRPKTKRTT